MKRYLLFAYDNYYPMGGFNDFVKSFDHYDDVISYIKSSYTIHSNDHYQIADFVNGFLENHSASKLFGDT